MTGAGPAGAFAHGEGTGKTWCHAYGGTNLGSYRDVYACKPGGKKSGKTPFDSVAGFQPTELANRFLFALTGHTLLGNDVAGTFVAQASADFGIPASVAGLAGDLPAAGDIISMWGGRSKQKQDGKATMVAVVTKVAARPSGWAVTTLNQGDVPTDGHGFDVITVSGSRRSWSMLDGFYTAFDWLRLVGGARVPGRSASAWAAAETPRRASARTSRLVSVACSSADDCTAAGVNGTSALLIARTGPDWRPADVPLPASPVTRSALVSVTCPSATVCVAAGDYASSGQQQGLLLTGHGSAWTATRAPLPGGAGADPDVSVRAVACPVASSCVAVGQYAGAGTDYALLLTGHGSSWTGRRAPLPSDAATRPAAELVAVACPARETCTAVGSYLDALGNRQGMLVTGHGTSWTAVRAPLPAAAKVPGAELSAVACRQDSTCLAAGSFNGEALGMLVTGSGRTWTAAQIPRPSGAASAAKPSFRGIACSTSSCVAVGSYARSAHGRMGLLVTVDGAAVLTATAPLPSGAASAQGSPGAQLVSVACPSAAQCLAVGRYTDTAGDGQTLLLSGFGSSWLPRRAPVPGNARSVSSRARNGLAPPTLMSVACPAAGACVSVGSYPARKPGTEGMIITGSG
jgi:hypothetical protein